MSLPLASGLYDPRHEHDACGVGFVAALNGRPSHAIVRHGIQLLLNLVHRGATGCDPLTGDGAGILIQMPHAFFKKECEALDLRSALQRLTEEEEAELTRYRKAVQPRPRQRSAR